MKIFKFLFKLNILLEIVLLSKEFGAKLRIFNSAGVDVWICNHFHIIMSATKDIVNGNRYEGNWADDVKNGLGRFYHLDTGQLQEGCWVNDTCIKSKMTDVVREFVRFPTEYPIRPVELQDAIKLLEESELWLSLRIDKFDKNLQACVDNMYFIKI